MDIPVVVAECVNVAPAEIVSALIHVESAGAPHALTVIGKAGTALKRQPKVKSIDEARRVAALKVAAGYTVKVGLMQVSSTDLARFGIPLSQGFSPCSNILAGSRVYSEITDRVAKLGQYFPTYLKKTQAAISAYKTGSYWTGISNGYSYNVMRVMAAESQSQVAPAVKTPAGTPKRMDEPAREAEFQHDIIVDSPRSGALSNWDNM
jgi:type IV secretion system protein VirB1